MFETFLLPHMQSWLQQATYHYIEGQVCFKGYTNKVNKPLIVQILIENQRYVLHKKG